MVWEPKYKQCDPVLTTAVFLAALVASCLRGAFPIPREGRLVYVVERFVKVIELTNLQWTCGRFAIGGDNDDDDEATGR